MNKTMLMRRPVTTSCRMLFIQGGILGAEESGAWALVLEFNTIDRDNQRVWMRRGGEIIEEFSPQDERA
jgi:hypothetical protein